MADLKLLELTEFGIKGKSLTELYSMLVEIIKTNYGVEVDITPDNADGIIQRVIATFLKEVADLGERMYELLNINRAEGAWLDSLVSLSNIVRRGPRATRAVLTIVIPEDLDQNLDEYEAFRFVDEFNRIWSTPYDHNGVREVPYYSATKSYEKQGEEDVEVGTEYEFNVISGSYGDWVLNPSEDNLLAIYGHKGEITEPIILKEIEVVQFTVIELGHMEESDEELKARKNQMGVGVGSKTLTESIVAELIGTFPILDGVTVWNNNTLQSQTLTLLGGGSITVPIHDVCIFIKPKYGSIITNVLQKAILERIRSLLTPGIRTWWALEGDPEPTGYVALDLPVANHDSWTEKTTYIESQPNNAKIKLLVIKRPGYDEDQIKRRIRRALIDLAKTYEIGQRVYAGELFSTVESTNISKSGATFKLVDVKFGGSGTDATVEMPHGAHWYVNENTEIELEVVT